MNTFSRKLWAVSVAAVLFSCLTNIALFAQTPGNNVVPIPEVTGPVPVSGGSVPFLASERNFVPLDLSTRGYVEEEFMVNGDANVYDWEADGTISVRTSKVPYTTRILVRRPASAARFSGNVIVELMNTARRFDWPMLWGYSRDYFLEHGDAWVGVTMPAAAAGLKAFDPTRYAAVSFANPSSVPCSPGDAISPAEEGLRWDSISQVAALLKSDSPGRPLGGLDVKAVFLTTQGGDLLTYINAIHPHAALSNGMPVYDGYLLKSPSGPSRINQCAEAPGAGDPRWTIRRTNVPVIVVVAQGEVVDATAFRRPDSDQPYDKFRMYEIAGAGHIDKMAYAGFPSLADQRAAVGSAQGTLDWPFNAKCDPEIPLMPVPVMTYAFDAAFAGLERWAREGVSAPRASRIELKNPGTPEAGVVTDENGNGRGGVRNPYVDVPAATLYTNSTGPGVCREMGHEVRFGQARFQALYPSAEAYADRVAEVADRLVRERWLTTADSAKIKRAARERVSQ